MKITKPGLLEKPNEIVQFLNRPLSHPDRALHDRNHSQSCLIPLTLYKKLTTIGPDANIAETVPRALESRCFLSRAASGESTVSSWVAYGS